ncbi:recombinase family protein [Anaeromicrobium sediminis]|uniref:recombinase family protein n=1 Tax=Anaeromicrobium sediminis TaxID=1478221 RepID=UPI001594F6C9|nr:recombinase family protein [Anaeromicrobium sediminis]
MKKVCIYLRKSRGDENLEQDLSTEALRKHEDTLLDLADKRNYIVTSIKREIVSGDSLISRPEMLSLLKEVDNKNYYGVLCMDIDRLGRGNMREQGLILDTFKKSHTKIITPRKIYDLNNEFDEEYSEFEAFMARKELKIITRRLQRGRIRSIEEGNYISPNPPFGYLIKEEHNERFLIPKDSESLIVKKIFHWYTTESIGSSKIAHRLNDSGYTTHTNKPWNNYSILNILKNPIYTGKITWKKTRTYKDSLGNKHIVSQNKSNWMVVDGKHEALITKETYEKAQSILSSRRNSPVPGKRQLKNPLAGVIFCEICNKKMILRPYKNREPQLICTSKCGNKSSKFSLIETSLICNLRKYFSNYPITIHMEKDLLDDLNSSISFYNNSINYNERQLRELYLQKTQVYNYFERKIYDKQLYEERVSFLKNKELHINNLIYKNKIHLQESLGLKEDLKRNLSINRDLMDHYFLSNNIEEQNRFIKSLLYKVTYYKPSKKNLTLKIYPKLRC